MVIGERHVVGLDNYCHAASQFFVNGAENRKKKDVSHETRDVINHYLLYADHSIILARYSALLYQYQRNSNSTVFMTDFPL